MNNLKVGILLTALTLVFVGVGFLVGRQVGMAIAFMLALVLNFGAYWFSDKLILRMYRAQPVNEIDNRRLYDIVRKVSQNAMLPTPKLYIIPTQAPNAFATGRNEENAAVAVTSGLLEILNDAELEGVIGHEIGHIMNKDMLIMTIVATLGGAIGILSSMARWGAIFGGVGKSSDEDGGPIGLIVAIIVAPLVALLIQTAISRTREYKADAKAGELTNHYLPLATALEKLHKSPVRLNLDRRPATAHLFIARPLTGKRLSSLFSTHPPVEKRIEKLKELALTGGMPIKPL